jgi:hypothetical protein
MRRVPNSQSEVLVFPSCKRLRERSCSTISASGSISTSHLRGVLRRDTDTDMNLVDGAREALPVLLPTRTILFLLSQINQSKIPSSPRSHFFLPFPTSSVTVCPSPYPKFFISSCAIKPLSMRQFRYPLLSSLHSGELTPRAVFRHRRYCFIKGWHSASWSRGKEPFAGGLGRPILTPVPGAPKVDILV